MVAIISNLPVTTLISVSYQTLLIYISDSKLTFCSYSRCLMITYTCFAIIRDICLRNKSWNPECVLNFNKDWRNKFTNIHQPMLKLKSHSGFHDLVRF